MQTGHKPKQPQCALGSVAGYDADKVKRDGWISHGILVVCPDDPRLTHPQREMVIDIGLRLYGESRTEVRRHE